ncbi:hypothetical protein GS597_09235 [Synechococcales cyanobacterium C]|uniref:Uncharacterized protein n=1 Tax=Petrachloros mirabilis ULC683 TaxID=2781853 RepID=A0A8K1ZZ96_9CYAN|nr:hypothetical protein [Petrachloros mirabilis]NCJ06686.1 hypothetical protein [Petrachloros mirabilis ULC683]
MSFPFGESQTFVYGQGGGQISVVLSEQNFAAGAGEGYLALLGYDRQTDPTYQTQNIYNARNQSFWVSPQADPQVFAWSLQELSAAQYFGLWGMYLRQQVELQPVTLLDQRLAMQVPSPRARAKVGALTGAPAISGCEFIWPIYKVWLDFSGSPRQAVGDHYTLQFQAKEILPAPGVADDQP